MNSAKYILPNKGNIWAIFIVFLPLTFGIPGVTIYQGDYFNLDAWAISAFGFVFIAFMYSYIRAQKVTLGDNFIRHRSLGFFKLNTKEFKCDDLDYWKIERLTLVVAKKDGKVPDLPHGPFADLSDVMLIPSSLFSPRTKEITAHLTSKGVNEKK